MIVSADGPPSGVPLFDAVRIGLSLTRGINRLLGAGGNDLTAKQYADFFAAGGSVGPDPNAPDRGGGKLATRAPRYLFNGVPISRDEAKRIVREHRAVIGTPGIAGPAVNPRPQLPTGGDILEDLLRRPRAPAPPPPSELERLLRRGPQSDFERLLERTVRNPDVRPRAPVLPSVAAAAGRTLLGTLGLLLYPSAIGYEAPIRTGRRPRAVRRPPVPPKAPPARPVEPVPSSAPVTPPRTPPVVPSPGPLPQIPPPIPGTVMAPLPPVPLPSTYPQPYALPSAPQVSFPFALLAAPLLLSPFILHGTQPRQRVPGRLTDNLSVPNLGPALQRLVAPNPLTLTQTGPIGSGPNEPCVCTRAARPRKKRCTNPIVSKRTRTDANRKFLTITRELKCP